MTQLTNLPQTNLQLIKNAAQQTFPTQPLYQDLAMTQAILESNLGGTPSELAVQHNNLFGIKGGGNKGIVSMMTHEYIKGKQKVVMQNFAENDSIEASFDQYKHVLDLDRYNKLKDATTFEDIARAVWLAGYATDPKYPQELINIYNRYIKDSE